MMSISVVSGAVAFWWLFFFAAVGIIELIGGGSSLLSASDAFLLFAPPPPSSRSRPSIVPTTLLFLANNNEWSTTDNWDNLSTENPSYRGDSSTAGITSSSISDDEINDNNENDNSSSPGFAASTNQNQNQQPLINPSDVTGINRIAYKMDQEALLLNNMKSVDDDKDKVFIDSTIDKIFDDEDTDSETETTTASDDNNDNKDFFDEDEMGTELSLLIRCNDRPEQLLLHEGRALPPLTDDTKYDVSQLVDEYGLPTPFFVSAIDQIFQQHSTILVNEKSAEGEDGENEEGDNRILRSTEMAQWLQQSLINKAEEGDKNSKKSTTLIGQHDKRVTSLISLYGKYGTGYVTAEGFRQLYLDDVIGNTNIRNKDMAPQVWYKHLKQQRQSEIRNVWRELENHGIKSPAVEKRERILKEMAVQQKQQEDSLSSSLQATTNEHMIMDECEIIDETYLVPSAREHHSSNSKSSYQKVELADDKKTPLWLKDGQFVFIDEESCIGCTQCALAAPASFTMLEYDGRARAFSQRNSPDVAAAVASCPADCMHYVNFRELKKLESARDNGDGRDDHRHFGTSPERGYINHIPLHVAGRDSDANHRSSWYHYLKNKCYKSKQCPQRGCYDCPMYASDPQSNPHFQKRLEKSTHIRAEHFIDHGMADMHRKTEEL